MPSAEAHSGPKVTWTEETHSLSWSEIVRHALEKLGGTASLAALYSVVERHPRTKIRKHWKAKVRQVLGRGKDFVRKDGGAWSFRPKHSETVK